MAYTVKIKKIIETTIVIDNAASAKEAVDIVETYGLIEAVSDFPMVNEDISAKIVGKAQWRK